jgi:hypothetical protein
LTPEEKQKLEKEDVKLRLKVGINSTKRLQTKDNKSRREGEADRQLEATTPAVFEVFEVF